MMILQAVFRLAAFLVVYVAVGMGLASSNCGIHPSYEVIITRTASSAEEMALITRAEAECPPYEEVAAAFSGNPPAEGEACLWYHLDRSTRIPFAITAEAIEYYADLVEDHESSGNRVSVEFAYEAHVEAVMSGAGVPEGAVQAVQMSLSFNYVCGGLCGIFFDKQRTVYFDSAGNIVEVTGDGPTEFAVA